MGTGRIRVLRAIPGSTSLGSILSEFSRKPNGIVTAFSDQLLPLCRRVLGDNAPVDVLSFSELVRNFLVLCGEESSPLVQSGHKRAAIAYACQKAEFDSPFYRCASFPGFHEAVDRTLEELHDWGIHAREMRELAMSCSQRLSEKLRGLADIDESVERVVEELGRQMLTKQIEACIDSILEMEEEFSRILVFTGSDESPSRIEWLRWAAAQGIEITVVVERHATDAPIFQGADKIVQLLGAKTEQGGPVNQLLRNLFTDQVAGDEPISVSVVSAADPLAEVEWALRDCLCRPDSTQCAIYVRDIESYAPLIESAAKRFGVPIQMARRAPLLTNSFARLTLSALLFCASNDVRTLASVYRSSYVHLSGLSINELEEELRVCYAAKREQWATLEAWVGEHCETHEWLQALLEWRSKSNTISIKLTEWYRLLQEFNRDQRFPWAQLENKGGAIDERDRRSRNQMERLLANHISVDSVTDESSLSINEFVQLCNRLWSTGDVSIPSSDHGIHVTSDGSSLGSTDVLHVLGMLEGVFPRRRSEDPVLTDSERHEINSARVGKPGLSDSHTRAKAERDEFYRVCAASREHIAFSYPLADEERDSIPAFYLSEVVRAAGTENVTRHDYPRPFLAPKIEDCTLAADVILRQSMEAPKDRPLPVTLITDAARRSILPLPGEAFHPSVLRDVLKCPFMNVAKYRLGLRAKRRTERWNSLRKIPLSVQLLAKHDLDDAERILIGALEAELDHLYARVPEWELQLLRSGGQRLVKGWIDRERGSRDIWKKDAGTLRTNVAFGTHGVKKEMPKNVTLEGMIPGISRLGNYNVAHIYGSAPLAPKKIQDPEKLYFGLYYLAMHEPGRGGAIELESMGGKRTLMLLGRNATDSYAANVAEGLQIMDLSTEDDVTKFRIEFYQSVKQLLAEASERIASGRIDPTPGEHCERCEFGEICRRSLGFGELESALGLEDSEDDV